MMAPGLASNLWYTLGPCGTLHIEYPPPNPQEGVAQEYALTAFPMKLDL